MVGQGAVPDIFSYRPSFLSVIWQREEITDVIFILFLFLCTVTPAISNINEVSFTPIGSVSFADPLTTNMLESQDPEVVPVHIPWLTNYSGKLRHFLHYLPGILRF